MKGKINAKTAFSLLVLLAGIIFYVAWSAKFNAWTDIGVYTVTIILVGFGAIGSILSLLPSEE
ncbi:MAG: hypothetical protein DRN29_06525 [Thermoplasmata archaeon]|nr:MAG: hypothetical protein DRN29_06525 [Thermoplasmata archaeon]